ncbi:Protein PLANT CADMIUM RESISTANCE 8 [Rhynchospora pubera]|uniref:Protein PLANT CADMIUM RESISTANCE 8 n=1 Tax=Rhynchospora pubera TaxID=906938 RepID=A0AAV8CKA5_9POAL|nr:Protein PLANT CADMIUM RESISTANCE 8 [Rhynchospora pubera]KAJ4814575.1 Protein PLANT CADMIUM RESISTANCE 8 [Rhynchospora pubera]
MASNGKEEFEPEIQDEAHKTKSCSSINEISIEDQSTKTKNQNSFCNFFKSLSAPTATRFKKFGPSPSVRFRQIALERDDLSRSVHSENHNLPQDQNHLPRSHFKEIDWAHMWSMAIEWIRNPLNMALFIWILCVAVSGAILFMVMTGMLNHALPKKSQRDTWFEVNNQILNALFTLMCLYQHPQRIYHLVLLLRWSPEDILRLRKVYCKNGMYKPHEWAHMMVIIALLNINCLAQYGLCGLNLGYPRSERPAIGVAICISVAIGAAAFAGLYNVLSPLGKDYDLDLDEEAQHSALTVTSGTTGTITKPAPVKLKSLERRYSFVSEERRFSDTQPQWIGGILDFWDDISLAYQSIFCFFCVFGWNMQRLGFGNMFVHIMTFILFCSAPFFIFNLAAVNINNENLRTALGLTGIILCFLGLLYGGFWRIQMRKRYNLPKSTFLCFSPSVTDCVNWLCCCWCTLAQELRTADFYEITEDRSFADQRSRTVDGSPLISPLPREDGTPLFTSGSSSPFVGRSSPSVFQIGSPGKAMKAPMPSIIEKDGGSAQ